MGIETHDDADVAGGRARLHLRPEREAEVVQGGLCGAIVGAAGQGHEGEAAGDEDHGGCCGGGAQRDEVREEGGDGQQRGGVVCVDLAGDLGGQLVVRGVGEVQGALDACVEDDGG